jgi:hypothetical protein
MMTTHQRRFASIIPVFALIAWATTSPAQTTHSNVSRTDQVLMESPVALYFDQFAVEGLILAASDGANDGSQKIASLDIALSRQLFSKQCPHPAG